MELDLDQKKNRISILENEVKDIDLDNSKMLQSIVDLKESEAFFQKQYNDKKTQFDKYVKDYPLKVGNIGGVQVNVDTVMMLQQQAQEAREEKESISNELRVVEKAFKQHKKDHS